jgi:hypothetical protein
MEPAEERPDDQEVAVDPVLDTVAAMEPTGGAAG